MSEEVRRSQAKMEETVKHVEAVLARCQQEIPEVTACKEEAVVKLANIAAEHAASTTALDQFQAKVAGTTARLARAHAAQPALSPSPSGASSGSGLGLS